MPKKRRSKADLQALNRWARARVGTTHPRDNHDDTLIRYRNEMTEIAKGHPSGYKIWPLVAMDINDATQGDWLHMTVAWEAWRNGKPDKQLGIFKVRKRRDAMSVLEAAEDACAACFDDEAHGGVDADLLKILGGADYRLDFTVFTLHDNEIYLDHAQIYTQYEHYRREQNIPVHRTDSARREMNRRYVIGRYRAIGPLGKRRFHIADVAHYTSFGMGTVKDVFGASEEEIRRQITEFWDRARRRDEGRRPDRDVSYRAVPTEMLHYASMYIEMLRAQADEARPTKDKRVRAQRAQIDLISDMFHQILETEYDPASADDLRCELGTLCGVKTTRGSARRV